VNRSITQSVAEGKIHILDVKVVASHGKRNFFINVIDVFSAMPRRRRRFSSFSFIAKIQKTNLKLHDVVTSSPPRKSSGEECLFVYKKVLRKIQNWIVLLAKLTLSRSLSSRRSHPNPAERRRREIIKLKSERNVIFHIKWCLSTHGNDMFHIAEQTRQREKEKSFSSPAPPSDIIEPRSGSVCCSVSVSFFPFKRSGISLWVSCFSPPNSNPLLLESSLPGTDPRESSQRNFAFSRNKHEWHDVRHEIYSY
jgi:hypothetical protein